MTHLDWTHELVEQLDWHWTNQLRPRLAGLSDDEYLWEPVPDCWSIRRGEKGWSIDWAFPAPDPAPVTTIAWRMVHLTVGVFGQRTASHFGGPAMDYDSYDYADTAATALRQLDDAYAGWRDGVRGMDADGLAAPCGKAEGPYAEFPMATLVLHINREAIHHGAEISLLRDLYLRR